MKKTGFAIALIAMLVMPGVAGAAPTKADSKAASKECHELRAAMGKENFRAQFGNFGKCVSKKAKEEAAERKAARKAAKAECKQQGLKGKAYADCVKQATAANKADADAKDKNKVNAAKTCREQQKGDPDGFATQWGTKKNAFGKCVSATARAKNDEPAA